MPVNLNTSPSPITFHARWQDCNSHLVETTAEKITRIFCCFINNLIASLVIPATQIDREYVNAVGNRFDEKWYGQGENNSFLKSHFTPSPIEVTTPDEVTLRGTFFKNIAAAENAPTVILFQPNSAISKQGAFDWILEQAALQDFPYNFIYFDHRGCAESDGSVYAKKNLVLDGESIYQFARDKLQVPVDDIHFYGWSLGGGIIANVKAMHASFKGRYVNERSFTEVIKVVENFLTGFIAKRAPVCIQSCAIKTLSSIAAFWISLLNWNIQTAEAIGTFKGKTLIVHHPEDEIMMKEASLYQSFFKREIVTPEHIQHLNLNRCSYKPFFIHGAPLVDFILDDFNPAQEISKFLFSSDCSFSERLLKRFADASPEFRTKVFTWVAQLHQNGGYYWGSGEDAFYNRNGLSLTNQMRTTIIALAKLSA